MANGVKYKHGGPGVDGDQDGDGDRSARQVERYVDRETATVGLIAGSCAVAATFLVTLAAAISIRAGMAAEFEDGQTPPVTVEAAWTVLVNLGTSLETGGEKINAVDLIYSWGFLNLGASPVFILLSFGAIALAGYLTAAHVGTAAPRRAVGAALFVVPAYLAYAVGIGVAVTWSPDEGVDDAYPRPGPDVGETVSVVLTDAVVYAGIVWPAVFATLGAICAIGFHRVSAGRS
ncbi:hypothetical protein [Halovivax gelatinilyticus]|uniref:hypothetical protein n=1 Tax=Halovivax gelatinilyticus TaxID=2961597 RepID=UPI0020CA5E83|nr:hypothetical protein [Halovivax gelatinilyticus]